MAIVIAVAFGGTSIAGPVDVSVTKLSLQPGENEAGQPRERVGRLTFRGGLQLSSADNRFGGFSALQVAGDGGRLVALSDDGNRLDARLVYDIEGHLAGLRDARLQPLLGTDGKPLARKIIRDAESLAHDGAGGLIVGFEHRHRLWHYPKIGLPRPLLPPAQLASAPRNQGIEALTRLADNRLLMLTEGLHTDGDAVRGWLGRPRQWQKLTYQPNTGYRVTAAATMPGGDVLLIERRFSPLAGISILIKRLAGTSIRPGQTLSSETLARIEKPMEVDNFEGIDVRHDQLARILIYIISDDNFSILQRTLLMLFELAE